MPIDLYAGELELVDEKGRLARGTGIVSLYWRPQPAIRFSIADQALRRDIGSKTRLRIRSWDVRANVHVTNWSIGGGEIRGVINRAHFPETAEIRELRFLVANLPFFRGSENLWEERPRPGGGTHRSAWAGRLVLEAAPWRLTLDTRSDERSTTKRLKDEGEHEVTHTASLRRQDGREFSVLRFQRASTRCGRRRAGTAGRTAPMPLTRCATRSSIRASGRESMTPTSMRGSSFTTSRSGTSNSRCCASSGTPAST